MQNPSPAKSHYRIPASTQSGSTATPGRKKRTGKLGESVVVTPEKTKKGRKTKAMKEQEEEKQRLQQQKEEEERQRQIVQKEQEMQQMAFLRWQREEQAKQEKARREREEREFHTYQRRLAQQDRLQEGQHAWKLEWQREQAQLRERLYNEELCFQAQEVSRSHGIPLSDMVHGEYLQDYTQPN